MPTLIDMRTCVICGAEKPEEDFPWADRKRGFRRRACRECFRPINAARASGSREKRLGEYQEKGRAYHMRNRDQRNAARRQRAADVPERVRRDKQLRRWFRIGLDQYEQMLSEQGGVCAICRQAETMERGGKLVPLAVDHDHETDRVRGLLCTRCNVLLGMAADDPDRLRAAIDYLEDR